MSKHHHLSLNDATPEDWDRVSRPKHYSSQNDKFPDLECIDAIKASMSPKRFRVTRRATSSSTHGATPTKTTPRKTSRKRRCIWAG